MGISKQLLASIEKSSMIRRMFEEGERRRAKYGAENVFDLSIGNPIFEPPAEFTRALLSLLNDEKTGWHRYMPNAGYLETRNYIASRLEAESGLEFTSDDIIMTVGAAGAINVAMKTLLNPGDEVIVFSPYFMEYDSYVANHGGHVKPIKTAPDFQIDYDILERELSPNTKAVLINSPNNPTGVVYSKESLDQLGSVLSKKSTEYGFPIWLVADEPYKKIVFDITVPSNFTSYDHTLVATSFSKDLAIPGERIGFLAISPRHQFRSEVQRGAVLANRILGFINAPALMQRMLPVVGDAHVDIAPYRRNRDLLYQHLIDVGFNCIKPQGTFYLFPESPVDDMEFIRQAQELNLLLVPGSGFGCPGYFRVCFCYETSFIEKSLPLFTQLAEFYHLKKNNGN